MLSYFCATFEKYVGSRFVAAIFANVMYISFCIPHSALLYVIWGSTPV
jgi:hypothetical protein